MNINESIEKQNVLFYKLCEERGLTLYDFYIDKDESYEIDGVSWSVDTVWVGKFTSLEFRLYCGLLAIGYHDARKKVGDFESWPYKDYCYVMAIGTALELADKNNIIFSKGSLEMAYCNLKNRFKDNHPEKTPTKFYNTAKRVLDDYIIDQRDKKISNVLND